MENLRQVLGARIRSARKRLNLTQEHLAELAGFPAHQIVSQIEKGEREVKAWELAALARALRIQLPDLLAVDELALSPIVLWRKQPAQERETIEADFVRHCRDYAALEQLFGEVREVGLPLENVDVDKISFAFAKRLAERIGKQLDLGSRPAASLATILEDGCGVKIWYEDLGEEGSAASSRGSFGCAVLMNSVEPPWRRNFNLAHEVFHLLTWESIPPASLFDDPVLQAKIEQYANAFASAILLPAESLRLTAEERTKDNQISITDLIDIARFFEVSTDALLYRLLNLGCLEKEAVEAVRNDPAFRASDRSTMHVKWWNPPPMPSRYVRLAFMAYQKGRLSRARLAQYLDKSLPDLTSVLLEYGLDDREDYEAEVHHIRC